MDSANLYKAKATLERMAQEEGKTVHQYLLDKQEAKMEQMAREVGQSVDEFKRNAMMSAEDLGYHRHITNTDDGGRRTQYCNEDECDVPPGANIYPEHTVLPRHKDDVVVEFHPWADVITISFRDGVRPVTKSFGEFGETVLKYHGVLPDKLIGVDFINVSDGVDVSPLPQWEREWATNFFVKHNVPIRWGLTNG